MRNTPIQKYLLNYAEKEAVGLEKLNDNYDHVVVIPVYKENAGCLSTVFSQISNVKVLIIVVVNSPEKSDPGCNLPFINDLMNKSNAQKDIGCYAQLMKFDEFNDVVLVDRNSSGLQIDARLGVGLARKIGADIALKLFADGHIKYPWIFSTDADVILPTEYFSIINKSSNDCSAIVADFNHFSDCGDMNKLQYLYDFKLRYYHSGIQYAGSSYDYIPLGSTLIVHMESYAQVRGFPKKNAGEDFYLLNKVAKIKPVKNAAQEMTIMIRSRLSDRVPFGTGPALAKINELNSTDDYTYYHPQCFVLLKQWLVYLKNMWKDGNLIINAPPKEELSALFVYLDCQKVFTKCHKQITSNIRWQQFVHQWFDAFKTLKAVHFFDKKIVRLNYSELISHGAFAKVVGLKL